MMPDPSAAPLRSRVRAILAGCSFCLTALICRCPALAALLPDSGKAEAETQEVATAIGRDPEPERCTHVTGGVVPAATTAHAGISTGSYHRIIA